jgi:Putative adhesin
VSGAVAAVGPRRRGLWLAVAALTGLLVALACGSQAWAMVNRHTASRTYVLPHPVRTVEVYAGTGDISVVPGRPDRADRVDVSEKLAWSTARPRVVQTWVGDTLQLHTGCTGGGFFLLHALQCQVSLVVSVPPATAVFVSTADGSVEVRGVSGDVTTRTGSGTTHLVGLRGDVSARASSGDIDAEALRSARTSAQAGSGSIELQYASAPRSVSTLTGSGSSEIVVPRGRTFRVGGASGSGNRYVQPGLDDPDSAATLTLTAGSGATSAHYG